jgi:hypothetical protein
MVRELTTKGFAGGTGSKAAWMDVLFSRTGFSREEAGANTINCSTGRSAGAGSLANLV